MNFINIINTITPKATVTKLMQQSTHKNKTQLANTEMQQII